MNNTKKNRRILAAILSIILFICGVSIINVNAGEVIEARLFLSAVSVDDKNIIFQAYEIENQRYFKLQDIARALSDSEKKFDIEWDDATNSIKISNGKEYTPSGTEMKSAVKGSRKITKTLIEIYSGEELHKLNSYLIGSNYYFALPDLAPVLDIPITNEKEKFSIITQKTPTLLAETTDGGQEYIDKIIFMGDSTTNGLRAYGMLTGGKQSTQVWVPSNKTFSLFNQRNILIEYPETKENISVETAVSLKKPEYMVITLGVNGVSSMSEKDFKAHYKELIERILEHSPETKIMLNSVYPVARNYASLDKINNEKIDRANKWIYELAEEINVRFLDTNSALKDEGGWLLSNYQNGDGLHLAPAAYKTVLEYIQTHVYR